jgi:hydrogenase assembly chaperone HypC/HupF
MCLGIPGRVVELVEGYAGQLAMVDVQGAQRRINLGMLDPDQPAVTPGSWVLIHMGFAIEQIDEAAAADAMDGLLLMGSGSGKEAGG